MSRRAELRSRLAAFRTDADFVAFCIDYFPDIARRFSSTPDRQEKISLLLQLCDEVTIETALDSHSTQQPPSRAHATALPVPDQPPLPLPVATTKSSHEQPRRILARYRIASAILLIITILLLYYFATKSLNTHTPCPDFSRNEMSCSRGDPTSCSILAKCYDEQCRQGRLDYCIKLAVLKENGVGIQSSYEEAAGLFKKSCDAGSIDGCFYWAKYQEQGKYVPKDEKLASILYEKSCDADSGRACNNLGRMYHEGRIFQRNEQAAFNYYEKGCRLGYSLSCVNIAVLLTRGSTIAHDFTKAFSIANQHCSKDIGLGCTLIGIYYENGLNIPKNQAMALRFYEKGCALAEGTGCYNAGELLSELAGQTKFALEYYKKSCDLAEFYLYKPIDGCIRMGEIYETGMGVESNLAQAETYYLRACDVGSSLGCYNLGELFEKNLRLDPDGAKRLLYYRKACAFGDSDACAKLNLKTHAP